MDVETNKTCFCLRRLTEMDPHADTDALARRPRVRLKVPLHVDHGGGAGLRRREQCEEAISLGQDLPSVVGGEPSPNDPVVLGENLGVFDLSQTTEKRGRTFDIGEEEGE